MKKRYKIGSFCFEISCPDSLKPPVNFSKFETQAANIDYFYRISIVDRLPQRKDTPSINFQDLAAFQNNGLESRYLGVKDSGYYYAYYQEIDYDHADVYVLAKEIEGFRYDPIFTSLLALEKRIISNNGLILHCAYIKEKGESLLFSAPSGVGKSTQADLWHKYRDSEIINGDKALLMKVDGVWNALGWPTCGTSEICNNITTPIKAIITLEQSKLNKVSLLSTKKAFTLIYAQITLNRWNSAQVTSVLSMIDDLLTSVPVYHLACDISEAAVNCLENIAYKDLKV